MQNHISKAWGAVAGLLWGASVGHVLRLLELGWTWSGPLNAWTGRDGVACAAVVIYAVSSVLAWLERREALWVSVLGPLGGLTAVILLPTAHVDAFQVVLGGIQAVALVISAWLLWADPKEAT